MALGVGKGPARHSAEFTMAKTCSYFKDLRQQLPHILTLLFFDFPCICGQNLSAHNIVLIVKKGIGCAIITQ